MINYTKDIINKAKKEIVRIQVHRLHQFYFDYFNRSETLAMVNYFFDKIYNLDGKEQWLELAVNTFEKVKQMLKEQTRENIEQLIELNNLTDKLDTQMAFLILERGWEETQKLTLEDYNKLFVELGHSKERVQQLNYVLRNLKLFYELAHRPINSVIMKPARFMSKLLGVYPLFASVEEGYMAILPVTKEIFEKFYKEVSQREYEYIEKAFPELKKEEEADSK